jgi:FkbM family methyltransferase
VKLLDRLRRRPADGPPELQGPRFLEAFADSYPDAFFIEIGSNDGDQHDHLRPFILDRGWRGIMVEPVPFVFARLRANYGAIDRVALENVAVADHDGELPFYHLREASPAERAGLQQWYDGIGSFSRDFVLGHGHRIPDIAERLVETTVPTVTFDTLLARHGAPQVDLLLVDTEGFDFEILRAIDLERHRPRLVVHEHFHLSPADRDACRAHLEACGYSVKEEGFDTFSLRPDGDALTDAFHAFRPAVRGVLKAEDEP